MNNDDAEITASNQALAFSGMSYNGGATADNVFQTKQFWYNLIAYVAPPTECNFVVNEPEVALAP